MSKVSANSRLAIAIHGGAGTIPRTDMTDEKEAEIRAMLQQSIQAGYKALLAGESSTEAVIAAINVMEDSPLFNAGKGAVFNAAGKHEMDASIMEGAGLNAGAVASVSCIKNPIDLASRVMTGSEHVMLMGDGAEEFARQQGFGMMSPDYFYTDFRRQQLQRIKAKELASSDQQDQWFSTVGAVALDGHGDLAAGTSTGGTCGEGVELQNTNGHVVAYNICNRVELGTPLVEAAEMVVNDILVKAKGEGGVIAIDRQGNIATPFNSEGMYRASIDTKGVMEVSIYREKNDTEAALKGHVDH